MSDYSDLELQEQLMNQLEEMQTEIEQYKQIIADLQREVSQKDSQALEAVEQAESFSQELERTQSELMNTKKKYSLALSNLEKLNSQLEQARQSANSSQVQELVSTLQQQKNKIAEQAELIEKLNESDLIVRENDRLKQENSNLQRSEQNARQEAEATVSSVKREYASKQAELEKKIASANYRERQASTLEANLSHQADERAQKLAENKLKDLQGEYEARQKLLDSKFKAQTASYDSFLLGLLLYGGLATAFTAVRSEAFVSDFKAFFTAIWQFIVNEIQLLLKGGQWASQLGDKIPQPVVATIVHYLLLILFVGGIGIGVVMLIYRGAKKVFKFYTDGYADTLSLAVFLTSLAVSVYFAEPISSVIPINLLFLLILVHIVYVLIRWYVKGCKRSRGY